MNELTQDRSSRKNLFGNLMRRIESGVAPVVAPYMPERFYEIYRESLGASSERLQVLHGLPPATMELGYVPLRLGALDDLTTTREAWDAISQCPRLLIVGPVGSGKSTLLRSLAWEFAGQVDQASVSRLTFELFGQSVKELMPILVDLRRFSQGAESLFDVMLTSVAEYRFPRAHAFVQRRLESGQSILLLDGLESVRDPEKQAQISEMLSSYPRNIWLITTRTTSDLPVLPECSTLGLVGIEISDIPEYVRHHLGERSTGTRGILAACERSKSLAQLARMPLMIAAMCRALREKATRAPRLPTLYDACLQTLLEDWSVRSGFSPRHRSRDMLRFLQCIAYEMQRQERLALSAPEILSLIKGQLSPEQPGEAESLFETLTWQTGVLHPASNEDRGYAFVAPMFQSYLAAHWIVATEQSASLLPLVDEPWWRDTIILTASLLPDPAPLLQRIESDGEKEPEKWFMLAQCIAESRKRDDALHGRVADHLYALLEKDRAAEAGEADDHWQAAATAIAGMSRRQTKDYFKALVRDRDNPKARRRAALVLGCLGHQWAIPSLGAAIADEDPRVRQQAVWALGNIPSLSVVHVLPRALRSPFEGVRAAAAEALVKQSQSPELVRPVVSELISALDVKKEEGAETAQLAEQALAQVGSPAMPQLIEALGNRRLRPSQRGRVATALGLLGDDRALPILIDAILSERSQDMEGYIQAVAGIGGKAVPALIKALEGRDITTSGGVIEALARIGAPAVEPLVEAIAGHSPEIRRAAVHALGRIGAPAIEPLTRAMLHDARFEVRRRALEILGGMRESHVVSTLIQALNDDDTGVQINAVRYLGNLADASAAPPLIEILQHEERLSLRRESINSLSAIGDAQAVLPLLDALEEPSLREAASGALVEFGEQAVMPLIESLHSSKTQAESREAIWDILTSIGARARPGDENLLGVASTYAGLREQELSAEGILSLTSTLGWWEHGAELHQSLATADSLAAVRKLREISESRGHFEWLSGTSDWLRPQVRGILVGLRDIVEDINLFHKITRRESQRDALLSAIDKLEEMRELVLATTLSFEQTLLSQVVSNWHAIVLDVTKQLRGRASLLIKLLTPRLPLRDAQSVTTVVFSLFNEGDSSARNLSVTLRPVNIHGNGLRVVRGERLNLDPLGIGEERQVEIPVAPEGVRDSELVFETHYDDDERQGVSDRFSCRIEFYAAPSTYTPIEMSPYVVGMPIKETEMFFGRQDIFDWVRDNIGGVYQEQPLLIYGERRMGKTSVLYQLQTNPPTPRHICLLFDLQLYAYANTVAVFLFELAAAVTGRLRREGGAFEDPDWERFEANPHRAFLSFCDALDEYLGDRRIIIMMDEFGVLMEKVREGVFDSSIFDYLRGVTQRSNRFTFLFTGAYEVRRMQQDFSSILFNMPKVKKISYLSEGEATDLIVKPVEGLITYHPLAIQRIRTVTACHPYFVQYVCDELVNLARKEIRNYIEMRDVDLVVQEVILDATGNIENSIYDGLNRGEKLVLAALANVTDDVRVFVLLDDVAGMLERRHLGMPRDEILPALKALRERDLVTETRIGQQLRYSFRMGLVRMWLRQNEILLRLDQERET